MHQAAPRILGMLLLLATICHGQSLADAARANRKQKSNDGNAPKVISTDDLSASEAVTIHLVPGTTATGQGTFVAPGRGKHSYLVTNIDATQFLNGGVLHIRITVGDKASQGSFDLFPQGTPLPTEGLPMPLTSAHNVASGADAKIDYRFAHATTFQLAAEGSWNSKAGDNNTFSFTVDVGNP